jgi:SAM-dependent methyltransferase
MTPQFAKDAAARGVQIESSSIEMSTVVDQENAFDVIYLAAVLEHLYDPVLCLKRIRRALRPGGLVFIDVPNECSIRAKLGNLYMRLRGRDWVVNLSPTFPPFHVVGFCPGSLKRALSEARIEVVELQVVRWPDALPLQPGFFGMVEAAGAKMVNGLAHLLGDGDGIVCWGRKPDHASGAGARKEELAGV